MEFHVVDNFYLDIDEQRQLRIAGPGNHLFFGMSVLDADLEFAISEYRMEGSELVVSLLFQADSVRLSHPLVCNIRTLRNYTEGKKDRPTYAELAHQNREALLPKKVDEFESPTVRGLVFTRHFQDEHGQERYYGARLETSAAYTLDIETGDILIEGEAPIEVSVRTTTNIPAEKQLTSPVLRSSSPLSLDSLPPIVQQLYEQAGQHISYLVATRKTSSFEYGTIFPRDWIESAQLGIGDMSSETIDFMYEQSLKHVDEEGQGWHEDIIGEYRYLSTDVSSVDRKMIDIEPLYILGMDHLSRQFLLNEENARKLRAIGKYIVTQAEKHELITFKKKAEGENEYHEVGNWRDSLAAFPEHKKPVAPYDVNCVFYPQALHTIHRYHEFFGIPDTDRLHDLIEVWQRKKDQFLVYSDAHLRGYSLALHGTPPEPLSVPHIDESYDLFYGHPSLEDSLSFVDRLLSEEYFYTPVGPILVAATTPSLSEKHYHGKVIWPKQAGFIVAGLARQYRFGKKAGWPQMVLDHLSNAVIVTAESCFRGWQELGSVTELYYYDREEDRARFYLDQEGIEGQMSMIQLWSAAGCRRIIREYVRMKQMLAQQGK